MKSYQTLKQKFNDYYQLQYLQRILSWEEMIFMPEGSGAERAKSLATLKKLSHNKITNKRVKTLLTKADKETLSNKWDQINLQWFHKNYISLNAVREKLQCKSTESIQLALQAWRKCRAENNWKDFYPALNKSFQLIKEIATRKSEVLGLSPYDVLLDNFSSGLTQSLIDPLFDRLKPKITSLRKTILAKQQQGSIQYKKTPLSIDLQKVLARDIMSSMQFDFNHGRLDVSHHPYCDGIGTDIRITTRYDEDNLFGSLYSVIHETGHALYEQGTPKEWLFQPVGQAHCKVTHESLALLFENEVGRSKVFFNALEKKLYSLCGSQTHFNAENLFNANTRIKNTLIRLDADEISYILHIFVRYEIEKLLFNNEVHIKDLPDLWDEKMMHYFGLATKNNFKDGVMQDMHWAFGYFGYFPIYVCGQVMASQLFLACMKQNQNLSNDIACLNFNNLHKWLKRNVYCLAASTTSKEILKQATGSELNESYFLEQLKQRYQI